MMLAVICNPAKVPDEASLRVEIKRRWPDAGLMWLQTTVDDPGEGQARQALDRGADLVLVAGGDGTVADCAGVLANTGVLMALVPMGTGNLLARNLGLPLDLTEALDVAAGTAHDRIDLLEAGSKRFLVMAGMGFDAAMMRDTDENTKNRISWLAYVIGGARALRRTKSIRYEVSVDNDSTVSVRALAVLVRNVGELQGGMAALPDADPRDGLLDVIVVAPRSWRDIPGLLARLVRGHLESSPRTVTMRGRMVSVHARRDVSVQFDGDYVRETRELTVTVLPGAVRLCTR
jgi:YegS/Rv2252/BmrU family lipid kinase